MTYYNQVYMENESLQINEVLKFLISWDMLSWYPHLCSLYKLYHALPVSIITAKKVLVDKFKSTKTFLKQLSKLAIKALEAP